MQAVSQQNELKQIQALCSLLLGDELVDRVDELLNHQNFDIEDIVSKKLIVSSVMEPYISFIVSFPWETKLANVYLNVKWDLREMKYIVKVV